MSTTISYYDASISVSQQMLKGLRHVLVKAQKHCEDHKIDPQALLQARLYPDMFTMTRQVQIACDHAKSMASKLSGAQTPVFEDNETTFDDLLARIDKTTDYIKSFEPEQLAHGGEQKITIGVGKPWERTMDGQTYLLHFALPNFYFHITTAYDILRHNGVVLSKFDYLAG